MKMASQDERDTNRSLAKREIIGHQRAKREIIGHQSAVRIFISLVMCVSVFFCGEEVYMSIRVRGKKQIVAVLVGILVCMHVWWVCKWVLCV